jgi:hypothetical protein
MYGRDLGDRVGRLSGGDRRRNQVDDLSSMRSYRYTAQKASGFSVDQAFNGHVFSFNGAKIIIAKNRAAPGKYLYR